MGQRPLSNSFQFNFLKVGGFVDGADRLDRFLAIQGTHRCTARYVPILLASLSLFGIDTQRDPHRKHYVRSRQNWTE